ncbi:hypothetical protein EDB80DRAFT_211657 [Ilyonectria destructans]|nr:hypothetical protein EDB80DRAFT_211657 [Ilyonectria destructans]
MAQSIAVDREVSVTPGNGVVRPRAASSAYSLFHHQQEPSNSGQQNNVPGHRPRAKSHSNLVGRMEPEFEFQDNTLIDEDGNFRRGGSGIAELIDFLRNHAPPSDNFMSIPDESNDSKGKWAKIRKLAKRKSKSKLPDPITLPDSAVSGITTEGHRHIAISIPLDASPFGRSPRTQYPVYQNRNLRPPPARYGPTRAILNEKGVVTVLRTVTEDQEISAPSSPAIPRIFQTQPSPGSEVPRGPSVGNSYSTSGAPSTNNGHGKVSDYFGVSSSPPRTQPQDQFRRANDASRELQQQNYGQSAASSSAATRADGLPIRGSSLPATRFVFPPTPSIDAMMFEPTTMSNTLQVTSAHARDNSKDGSYQESLSKSILTSSDNEPVVADAKRVKTTSLPLGESPVLVSSKKDDPSITVITRSPLASDGHISPTASIHSTRSQTRRDKVRDKKRRDMEALRTTSRNRDSLQSQMSQMSLQSQQSQQSQQDDEHENKGKVSTDLTEEVSMSPKREKPPPLPLKSANRPSLCAIMVVSDVQPSPPQSAVPPTSPTQSSPAQSTMVIQAGPPEIEPPLRSPPLHGGFPKPPKTKPQFRPKPIPRVPSISGKPPIASPGVSFNNTSNPTPPQSVKGSPKTELLSRVPLTECPSRALLTECPSKALSTDCPSTALSTELPNHRALSTNLQSMGL